jgi:hypothetical protein
MAFLFKNKKDKDRNLSSRDGSSQNSPASRLARDDKNSLPRSTPTGSVNSLDNDIGRDSPDQIYGPRRAQNQDQPPSQQTTPVLQQYAQMGQQQPQPATDLAVSSR